MKTVFVLFDSLNRHLLGAYGGQRIPTPNFDRLAKRSRVYDKHYVGSLPCMPARRDTTEVSRWKEFAHELASLRR